MEGWAHKTAVIDDGAQIGGGTKVWHFCHVMPLAQIGQDCMLGQNTFVANHVVIGDRSRIQNNVSLYEGVILSEDVFVGPSVVFTNVLRPRVGKDQSADYVETRVEKGASIGANATIICGITIGAYAMIGAGSVVTKDVPPYTLVRGNPAIEVGRVDEDGKSING